MNNLTDQEVFELAYEALNEDSGKESPDNMFRQMLMEDLRPVFILFTKS